MRAETTRMYLQPPRSERIYTLWRDGKIMLGEIESPINKEYSDIESSGVCFLDADGTMIDFRHSEFSVREDGIPVHKLGYRAGKLCFELECFADFSRLSTCHIKLTVTNDGEECHSQRISFILRSDKEEKLIYGAPDLYCIYDTNLDAWLDSAASWRFENGVWRSGECYFTCDKADSFTFDEKRGIASREVRLSHRESTSFVFTLGKGEAFVSDYDDEKEKTLLLWERELCRIGRLPAAIANDAERVRIIKNLTVHLLQCFCYSVGGDDLYSRQGGLQRRVWTYEAMPVLEGLAKLGDFDDYIEPVIDVYFNKFYTDSGEIVPLGIHWAMASATVLKTFGTYALLRGAEYFNKYRDKAYKIFEWIKNLRGQATYVGGGTAEYEKRASGEDQIVGGLFPPMASCDDPLVFQAWHTTDVLNVYGIRAYLEACEKYGDPRSYEVRREYDDYMSVLMSVFEMVEKRADSKDELMLPHSLTDNNEEVTKLFEFAVPHGFVVDALDLEPHRYEKILNYYTRRGFMKGGLLNKMPDKACAGAPEAFLDDEGKSPIWYVCGQEYGWFSCLMRKSDYERCRLIIEDNLKYAMTDEYYMLERYNQKNPWYSPWSPNASCNGRMINMMLDFYADRA